MLEDQFIKKYTDDWQALESRLKILEHKGLKKLGPAEAEQFHRGFRMTSHHLAYARTHFPESAVSGYLNGLVGRCQGHIYAVPKMRLDELQHYFSRGFADLLRANRWMILLAFGLFILGLVAGGSAVLINPDNARFFLPAGMADSIKSGTAGHHGQWDYALMSSQIMTNNIGVSIKAFVYGITFGILTGYILFQNGALLGALTALIYLYGNPLNYWSLILPHGIIELSAIFISGGAGFMLAKGILLPGEYSRKHSLIQAGRDAVSLVPGIVVMLIVAGLIEGFFTPLEINPYYKLALAAATAILLVLYIRRAHRKSE